MCLTTISSRQRTRTVLFKVSTVKGVGISVCDRSKSYKLYKISSLYLHLLQRYEQQCKVWKMGWFSVVIGHSGSSAMSPFAGAHAISYSTLIETMRLPCIVFKIQQAVCRKSPILTHPTHIWPPLGVIPVEFRGDLWRQITRHLVAIFGTVVTILCFAVLVEHRLVTDQQTETVA